MAKGNSGPRGMYSEERFTQANMVAGNPEDSKGKGPEGAEAEQFSEETRRAALRVHILVWSRKEFSRQTSKLDFGRNRRCDIHIHDVDTKKNRK